MNAASTGTLLYINVRELQTFLDENDPRAAAALKDLACFDTDEWITLYRDVEGADEFQLAVLLRGDKLKRANEQAGFDVVAGSGRPGFITWSGLEEPITEYVAVGTDDAVALVHVRSFSNDFPRTVELAEDFRLCWDLYEDRDRPEFVTTDEVGERVVVAAWRNADRAVVFGHHP